MFAGYDIGQGRIDGVGRTRVGLVDAEHRALQVKRAVEERDLRADLEDFVFFRRRAVGGYAEPNAFGRRVERRAVGKVVTLRRRRMEDQSTTITPHLVELVALSFRNLSLTSVPK